MEHGTSPERRPSLEHRVLRSMIPGSRAGRSATGKALAAGLVALALVHLPLVIGYGILQRTDWGQIIATGVFPAPAFYTGWPLQYLRLMALSLFSLDLALWVALLMLLPLEDLGETVFHEARKRLRRRWLLTHAPLVPIAGFLVGARFFSEALALSGAGAAWFDPLTIASVHPAPAASWIRGEHMLMLSLMACFLIHLGLLAGLMRPLHWLRNMLLLLLAAAALTLIDHRLILPATDGGLLRSMTRARQEAERVCPEIRGRSALQTTEWLYDTFARTAADSPALRGLPAPMLPRSVVALPPLPLISETGLAVVLETGGSLGLAGGSELRVTGNSNVVSWTGISPCRDARVLKIDRGLKWKQVRPVIERAGSGPLQLAFQSMPQRRPRTLRPDAQPVLYLVRPGDQPPPGIPQTELPLGFAGPLRPPGRSLPPEQLRRIEPPRTDPYLRERPLDPLWQDALPLPLPPPEDTEGRTVLRVPGGAAWDDVLRGIAAAATGGSRRIYLVTRGSAQTGER